MTAEERDRERVRFMRRMTDENLERAIACAPDAHTHADLLAERSRRQHLRRRIFERQVAP